MVVLTQLQLSTLIVTLTVLGVLLFFYLAWTLPDKFPRPKSFVQAIFIFLGTIALTVVILVLFYVAILYSVANSLIEYPLFVTLVLAEVPIAIFLHYITGEHHRSDSEKTNDTVSKVRAISSFSHLHVYYLKHTWRYDYPELKCWIVNTRKNRAFYIREEIRQLIKDKVIGYTRCETEKELEDKLKGITKVNQQYQGEDLD